MLQLLAIALSIFSFSLHSVLGTWIEPSVLDACPGYNATNIKTKGTTLTADLLLAGKPCNVFGNDLSKVTLAVEYETSALTWLLPYPEPTKVNFATIRHTYSFENH